jgi:hypothetical protein
MYSYWLLTYLSWQKWECDCIISLPRVQVLYEARSYILYAVPGEYQSVGVYKVTTSTSSFTSRQLAIVICTTPDTYHTMANIEASNIEVDPAMVFVDLHVLNF